MKTLVQELPFYKKTSDLFQLYAQNPQAIFLDSSLQNELGRYSIILPESLPDCQRRGRHLLLQRSPLPGKL